MSYLLDTNACIAIINGRPQSVRHRLRWALTRGEPVALSSVALFELWYGVAKSARAAANTERLAVFLAPLETLEHAGTPIGAYDILLAGQAVCRGLILVTANVAEFARVRGLSWQNWAE